MSATHRNGRVFRRKFSAAKFLKGSAERDRLNLSALTSEHRTGSPYMARYEAYMSDGTRNPAQEFHDYCFRTKAEAVAHVAGVAL